MDKLSEIGWGILLFLALIIPSILTGVFLAIIILWFTVLWWILEVLLKLSGGIS